VRYPLEMYKKKDYTPYPWMEWAFSAAYPPGVNLPTIQDFFSFIGISTQDEIPWCSAFANWCMKSAGVQGTNKANARSWLAWEQSAACLISPTFGAVTVLWRESVKSEKGHVGFYVGPAVLPGGNHVLLLGGNQSHQVNISAFPESRVLGYRLPR